jgi:hypothetical protein
LSFTFIQFALPGILKTRADNFSLIFFPIFVHFSVSQPSNILTAESAAGLEKFGPSAKLKVLEKNCLSHYLTLLNFLSAASRNQPPGQNSTAAADICGSDEPSQPPS